MDASKLVAYTGNITAFSQHSGFFDSPISLDTFERIFYEAL